MRIAHVTATFPPYYSGTGLVCYANALELARRGHAVTVFTAAHPPGECAYPAELTVQRLPALFRVGNAPLLPGLAQLNGFDVVHLHFPFYGGAELAALAAWGRRMPLVITYHQDALLPGLLGGVVNLHDHTVGAGVLCSAKQVLFTTLDYGLASRARWLFAVCPERIGELPNGVDPQFFRPDLSPLPVRRRLGWDAAEVVLLVVAGLDRAHYFKGIEILLVALARLADAQIKLIVVGEGDLRSRYQRLTSELGLNNQVAFVGRVAAEDLPAYYAAADIGVLPSWTMGEAFGMVLLEAMASSKPVIATRLPGVRAVVSAEEDGLLAEPGDVEDLAQKIRSLRHAPERRRAMGARGRAKVELKYAWPKVVDRLEHIYQAAVSGAANFAAWQVSDHAR